MKYVLLFLLATACSSLNKCKPDPFEGTFCQIDSKDKLISCNEKTPGGAYENRDHPLTDIDKFDGYTLVPTEDFEKRFSTH